MRMGHMGSRLFRGRAMYRNIEVQQSGGNLRGNLRGKVRKKKKQKKERRTSRQTDAPDTVPSDPQKSPPLKSDMTPCPSLPPPPPAAILKISALAVFPAGVPPRFPH